MSIKTNLELATACKDVATRYKSLYVMGCFGAPLTAANKKRYTSNHSYNKQAARKTKINAATSDTYGFDCVNLIKGLLWGWNGDKSKSYGGAQYRSQGVPDIDANQMIKVCKGVSTDFSTIMVGEVVWLEGHIGVYIGGGLVVECSPKWADAVQITACLNIGRVDGYNGRGWTKHGRLPYITYVTTPEPAPVPTPTTQKEGTKVKMQTVKKGSKHAHVKVLQRLLIGSGYSVGSSGVDGSFGPATDTALRKYQAANGLAVDGSCGPATWAKLLAQ